MPSSATDRTARCTPAEITQSSPPAAAGGVPASDIAQKLAEAIAFGDVEGAQTLLGAFQNEVIARAGAAQSPLEREALLEEAIRSTKTLLHLARSLRAYASASLRETNRELGYRGPAETQRTWRMEA